MAIFQNLKNSVYLAIKIRNILVANSSASGGEAPRPQPGLRPWTPLGDFRPPEPLWFAPPGQIPSYATEAISEILYCYEQQIDKKQIIHFSLQAIISLSFKKHIL